jgi:hypothetical protein
MKGEVSMEEIKDQKDLVEQEPALVILTPGHLICGTSAGIIVPLGCTSCCCSSNQRMGQS